MITIITTIITITIITIIITTVTIITTTVIIITSHAHEGDSTRCPSSHAGPPAIEIDADKMIIKAMLPAAKHIGQQWYIEAKRRDRIEELDLLDHHPSSYNQDRAASPLYFHKNFNLGSMYCLASK
jgi:hypothetical protein